MSSIVITAEDIALYRRHDGDLDGFARSTGGRQGCSDAAWRTIDDLRQRAFIVATRRGSEAFARSFQVDLVACIPDAKVRSEFQQLVDTDCVKAHLAGR